MAITYEWTVTSMKVINENDFENVVIQTYWTKKGTDENGNDGSFNGATPLDQSSIDPNNFIPFEELTETIVLGWIQSSITDQSHIDYQIQKQIDMKKNPVIEKKTPWSTDPSANTP